MNTAELFEKYKEWELKASAYRMALAIIGIDKQTVAPEGGAAYRDKRTAILAGELFSIQMDPAMIEVMKELKDREDLDADNRKAVQMCYEETMKTVSVPKEEFVAYQNLTNEAYGAWLEAKTKSDYSIFAPYLKKIIEGTKKIYEYRDSSLSLYDRMLDDYEPGMTQEKYDVFFDRLKERIVPLIQKVTAAEKIDTSFLNKNYPVEDQKKFMDELLKYLRFDPYWGYQNETEHPFTSGTCENDCRTTTKYLPDNVASAVLSTIHEVGHATYGHQIAPEYDGTILAEPSMGMHESQSRLCENYLGRSLAFWEYNYPRLQEVFPAQLGDVSLENFVNAINASEPSLIRTEADELTYPLHILIRYEIEKGLFNGTISVDGLDQTWNEMYAKYLGVTVPDDRSGILQDVHWAGGSFGYFPTYALGSAFSAQFMHVMRKDLDVDECLRSGRYDVLMDWLKEHIHRYGSRYNADEVMRMATGEPFNPDYFLDYLEEKYTRLYHLQ